VAQNKKMKKKAAAPKAAKKSKPVAKAKAPEKSNSAMKATGVQRSTVNKSSIKLQDFITPLDDRLVVEIETITQTAGGLYIPQTASERPQRGKVLAVGRGHLDKSGRVRPMDVRLGDDVLFTAYSGTPMKLEGREVVILREADLLGVID
jgi:chaperonin GroES